MVINIIMDVQTMQYTLLKCQSVKLKHIFLTALDFILVMANVLIFFPICNILRLNSRLDLFHCSSAITFGEICLKTETAFSRLLIYSLTSPSTICCKAQTIYSASALRSSGTSVILRYELTNSQTDEHEMTSTFSLFVYLTAWIWTERMPAWYINSFVRFDKLIFNSEIKQSQFARPPDLWWTNLAFLDIY